MIQLTYLNKPIGNYGSVFEVRGDKEQLKSIGLNKGSISNALISFHWNFRPIAQPEYILPLKMTRKMHSLCALPMILEWVSSFHLHPFE